MGAFPQAYRNKSRTPPENRTGTIEQFAQDVEAVEKQVQLVGVKRAEIVCIYEKKIDLFHEYGIILLVVSPTAKWTAKSVSNSIGVTTQMAMWKRIAIFIEEIYADGF